MRILTPFPRSIHSRIPIHTPLLLRISVLSAGAEFEPSMASSHTLSAATIALATLASMVFCPCLQGVGANTNSTVSVSASTSSRNSGTVSVSTNNSIPAPAPAPSSGAPLTPVSPGPRKQTTPPRRDAPVDTSHPHTADVGESSDFRRGKTLGIILVATAGALQAVIVVFLFVKRKQMLKMVRMNGPSEPWNDVP